MYLTCQYKYGSIISLRFTSKLQYIHSLTSTPKLKVTYVVPQLITILSKFTFVLLQMVHKSKLSGPRIRKLKCSSWGFRDTKMCH